MALQPDMNEIQKTVQTFWKNTGKALTLYKTKDRGTVGGFFNDPEKFAVAAFEQSALADAPAVFMSLQVLAPGAEGNKLTEHAAAGFRQEHVEFYAWLLIDCDPVRDDGNRHQSTTETEKARAFQLSTKIRVWLNERRYENGLCDSGNGYHVYVPVDVARSAGAESIPAILLALKARFETPEVEIDASVGDPAQVIKVYGTVSRKGPDTPDRPHRLAKFVEWPAEGFSHRLGLQDLQMLLGQVKAELKPEQVAELEGRPCSDEVAGDDEVERTRRNIRRFLEVYELAYKEKVNGTAHAFPYQFHITCPFCVNSKNPEKTFLFPTHGAKMAFFCGEPHVGKCRDGIRRFWKDFEARVQEKKGVRFVEWESAPIICEDGYYGVPRATANATPALEGETTTSTLASEAVKAFKYLKVQGGDYDFVFAPEDFFGTPVANREGWFARGNVHIIGGSSGAGKTSLMIPALVAQERGDRFLRHNTFKLPYLILLVDRGGGAMNRTLKRLGCDARVQENIAGLEDHEDTAAISRILQAIESRPVMPAVVFIEGGDYMVSDTNKGGVVKAFMRALGKIAEHYHIAMILSVGAPKMRKDEAFKSKRDFLIGSEKWSRSADTILVMEEEDDGRRKLTVKTRNGEHERYNFEMRDGRLEEDLERSAVPEAAQESDLVCWAKVRHELASADERLRYWTRKEAQAGTGLSKAVICRQIDDAKRQGLVRQKPGPESRTPEYTYAKGESRRNAVSRLVTK